MHRFFLLGLVSLCPLFASAQTNTAIARMGQDMQMLNEQIGSLRAQVEDMQRQQAQMLKNYEALMKQQAELTKSLNTFVAQTETKFEAQTQREAVLKREISVEVSKQIEALAKETQRAIDAISKAQSATPSITTRKEFTNDYPETGFPHVVKSGETISGIARQYGSTIQDIINANQIANARGLRAGETIFVPVPQQ